MTSLPPSEQRDPRTVAIDSVSTEAALRMVHEHGSGVWEVVAGALPSLTSIVDETAARLAGGGRLHYFGAGTSGRLACLDAAELPPTFGVPDDLVVAHLAGGPAAMTAAAEGAEDDADAGVAAAGALGERDVAVGLSASGRAAWVLAALGEARRRGALTVLVSGDPAAAGAGAADRVVALDAGPEALAGSTRLNAGTAQKLLLNAFSTVLMVRLGRTYSNLMVGLSPANEKLQRRLILLLAEASGQPGPRCLAVLDACGWDGRIALLALLARVEPAVARAALDEAGSVRAALAALEAAADGVVGHGA